MADEKFPALRALYDTLQAERAALVAKAAPLRTERDELLAQMAPMIKRERELIAAYRAIEQPRLAEIDTQLGALAKAMGGKALSDAPPALPVA